MALPSSTAMEMISKTEELSIKGGLVLMTIITIVRMVWGELRKTKEEVKPHKSGEVHHRSHKGETR